MSLGRPCRREMWCSISSAVSLADGNLGKGTNGADLENLSTMVRIVVLPPDGGSAVTRTREM